MADPQTPAPLTTDDYAALHTMQMSPDPASQAQASALAKKLTPTEQQAFFDYQKTQHPQGEHGRVDNQVLGVPPELAAMMAGPIMKAATAAGLSTGQRIGAAFKSSLGAAHPLVKYEITRSALEHVGIPSPIAMAAAIAVSGYRTGAKDLAATSAPAAAAEGATATPIAAPAAAAAAPVATAAPPAAEVAPIAPVAPSAAQTAAGTFNAGQAMNDVRAVFKGIKIAPLPAEVSNAAEMIRAGVPAETAVARIIAKRPGVPADAIEALAKKLGTPSDATVAARVADRNATGRWSQ